MNEMIERVARAICHSAVSKMVGGDQSVATGEVGWSGDGEYMDRLVDLHWKEYTHTAQAAIEAMREPPDEIIDAAAKAAYGAGWTNVEDWPDISTSADAGRFRECARAAHEAMINGALKIP